MRKGGLVGPAGPTPRDPADVKGLCGALPNPVLLDVLCPVGVVVVRSRIHPGLVHDPVSPLEPSPPSLNWGGWP